MKRRMLLTSVAVGMALSSSCYSLIADSLTGVSLAEWLAAFVLAFGVVLVVAGAIAELASRFPGAIGVRTILAGTLGPRVGLFASYLYLLVIPAVASVESYCLVRLIDAVGLGISGGHAVALVFVTLLAVNCLGYALSLRAQFVMTVLLVVASLGVSSGPASPVAARAVLEHGTRLGSVASTSIIVIFLFMGFEWVTASGRRKEEYRRDMPLAMFVALGVLAVVYLAFAWSYWLLRPGVPASALLAYCVGRFGSLGRWLALTIGSFAAASTLNAGLLGGARMLYVLAREGALPSVLSRVWVRRGTPVVALASLCLVSGIAAYVGTITGAALELAVLAAVVECCVYALLLLAAFKNRQHGAAEGFRSRLPRGSFAVVAALLVAICVLVLGDQVKVIRGVTFAGLLAISLTLLKLPRAGRIRASA